ncbi:hypothetical protein HFC70_09210 [Agrobacterium sp. a22-2]|uniref:hypothetical protein n=1 Tax=Agrobacterium sp. a22-2 TaxID=2283840 RepID=UPI0014466652|nr:hypothetical protein [Agrobacterium sp. a22-2]NKN36534.1 hypothetical protein [Agrobacterium sp. a22-2]
MANIIGTFFSSLVKSISDELSQSKRRQPRVDAPTIAAKKKLAAEKELARSKRARNARRVTRKSR